MESAVPVATSANRRTLEKRGKMPDRHSQILIAKKSAIPTQKRPKTIHNGKVKKGHVAFRKRYSDSTWRYGKQTNLKNETLSKRSYIVTRKLPPDVDQTQLEIDGFYCICPEHYKGRKCEGKSE